MEMTMINNCYEPDREETIDKSCVIAVNICKEASLVLLSRKGYR